MRIWVYINGKDKWEKTQSGNKGTFGTTNKVSIHDILIFFYPKEKMLGMYQVATVGKFNAKVYDMLDYYEGTMNRMLQPNDFVEKYGDTHPKLCDAITNIMVNKIQNYL